MVTVELVYNRDCPNALEARTTLRRALTEAGLAAQWTEWEASSEVTPTHLRFYGSPTVLVNGRDVAGAEPGDASSCRVYEAAGTTSGVPPAAMIVCALLAANTQARRSRWGWSLLVAPAIGSALVPGLSCPACWPGYAALLSALGLGFVPTTPYLLPLTVTFLIIALAALAFRAESKLPLVLSLVAAMVILLGKFVSESSAMTYMGIGLLVAASLPVLRRGGEVAACPACASPESTRLGEPRTSAEEGR